jgi:hypothetical protein
MSLVDVLLLIADQQAPSIKYNFFEREGLLRPSSCQAKNGFGRMTDVVIRTLR